MGCYNIEFFGAYFDGWTCLAMVSQKIFRFFSDIMEWILENESELKTRGCTQIHILDGEAFADYISQERLNGKSVMVTDEEIRKLNTGLMLVACDAEGKMVMDSMAFDKSKSLFILDKFNGKPVVTINL